MSNQGYFLIIAIFIQTILSSEGTINNDEPMVEYYSYDDAQYVFFSQRVPWEEANMLCIAFDAKLAVLNNNPKAMFIAQAMAESNIAMEDAWLGGRRIHSTWYWNDGINTSSSQYVIPIDPDINDFPPWSRKPLRAGKECIAIDRKSHSLPNFVDLDCRLLRPFVCEKKSNDFMKNPVPSKWIKIKKNVYTLYHGRVTWAEAVTYCRSQGMRLAVVSNQNIVNILSHSMTKSRPDFENVWIGARYSYGQWIWLSTGSMLNSKTDDSGYPPWRFGKVEKNAGCLLLDRHLENKASFIEMSCNAKRDFVCEKYPEGELEDWMNEPINIHYENVSIMIYPTEKTWDESRVYCQEKGSILSYVGSLPLAYSVVNAMGDHPREIKHLWLGGLYNWNTSEWRWIYNNQVIPANKNHMGFPPWARSVIDVDLFPENSACLNLDRIDHTQPHLYGLNCHSKQAFACTINCEAPPPVANGKWDCIDHNVNITHTSKLCSLQCDRSFFTVGKKNVNCSSQNGWFSQADYLKFPICLDLKNYLKRLTMSLSEDLQNAFGYYFLLSHSNDKFNNLGLQLIRKLLTLFPLSAQRKMGMTNYFESVRTNIPFIQNDTCAAIQFLLLNSQLQSNEDINKRTPLNYTDWSSDIQIDGRKVVIIAIIDSTTAKINQDLLHKIRMSGHNIITIGSNDDWNILTSLATIGFDRHSNSYLFNEDDFQTSIDNLNAMKDRSTQCPEIKMDSIPYTLAQNLSSSMSDYSKESTTESLTSSPLPEQITYSDIDVSLTATRKATAKAETNDAENNSNQANEEITVENEDSSENTDADKYSNENDSDETEESLVNSYESTALSDNMEATVQPVQYQ